MRRAAIPSRAFLLRNAPVSGKNCTERAQEPRPMRAQRAPVHISSRPILMDQTRGRAAPRYSIPVLDKPIASGGWRACPSPGAMQSRLRPGASKAAQPRSSAPLTTEARIILERTRDLDRCERSERRSASLSGATQGHSREKSGIPELGLDQRRGRTAPPVLLASFLRSKTSDVQGRGEPPHPYASLFIRTK